MSTENRLTVIEKTVLLSGTPLFGGLATDEIALIAASTREIALEPGDLDPESAEGGGFYFILEGSIEVLVRDQLIRKADAGAFAGSLGAVGDDDPDEILRVPEPTRVLMLTASDFERAVQDHPDFAMALIRKLVSLFRRERTGS